MLQLEVDCLLHLGKHSLFKNDQSGQTTPLQSYYVYCISRPKDLQMKASLAEPFANNYQSNPRKAHTTLLAFFPRPMHWSAPIDE